MGRLELPSCQTESSHPSCRACVAVGTNDNVRKVLLAGSAGEGGTQQCPVRYRSPFPGQ